MTQMELRGCLLVGMPTFVAKTCAHVATQQRLRVFLPCVPIILWRVHVRACKQDSSAEFHSAADCEGSLAFAGGSGFFRSASTTLQRLLNLRRRLLRYQRMRNVPVPHERGKQLRTLGQASRCEEHMADCSTVPCISKCAPRP